jgi:hypothetical protein
MIMLAAAAPLVKLAPDTTPEQQSGVRDIDQALTIFWALVERLRVAAEEEQPIPQFKFREFEDGSRATWRVRFPPRNGAGAA